MNTPTVDREFFQKVLESAFTVQQSQMDGESLSAIFEFERSMMRGVPGDGAIPLFVDGTPNGVNASGVAVGALAVGPAGGVQNPLPGLEEEDRSSGALLSNLVSALSADGGGEVPADAALDPVLLDPVLLDPVLKDILEQARLATHASAAAIALMGEETVCRASTETNAEVPICPPGDEPRTAADNDNTDNDNAANDNKDAYLAASRGGAPEARSAPFPPSPLWTPSLLLLVIALAMLLGWMLGRVTLRRTATMKAPPPLVSVKSDATPPQSQSGETERADSNPPLRVAGKAETPETPSGGLVVYQDGKVIFRLKPSENVTSSSTKPGKTMVSRQIFASKNVNLRPRARTEVMVSLVIRGGTSEATVKIDGKAIGRLDANGSLELPNALTEGQHSIVLTKANFESREFPVTAKPPEFRLPDARLTPWPKLTFQTTTPNVTVKYQRSGDSQVHQAPASEKLILQPGQYDFTAEVPGFKNYTTKVNLVPGYEGSITLKLDPVPDYPFQDATQVVHDGPAWFKSKDARAFVQLKPGLLHETLIFTKPPKIVFWNKKIEWKIEASDGSAGVDYILEGQKMVRKPVIRKAASDIKEAKVDVANYVLDGQKMVKKLVNGEAPSDIKEAKVDLTAATQATSLSVQIDVDGSHVQIRNDKGLVLDSYTAPQHNFSGGRIGIKTDSLFVVRDR
jgi:hypothetical protein